MKASIYKSNVCVLIFSVIFFNGVGFSQQQSFTHDTGMFQVWIQDNGDFAIDCITKEGKGISWQGESTAFTGGPIWGFNDLGKVNGHMGSFSTCGDLVTEIGLDPTSNQDFDQVTSFVINDNGSKDPGPMGITAICSTYSNCGDPYVFISYEYKTDTSGLGAFYGGIFMDWNVSSDSQTDSGGYYEITNPNNPLSTGLLIYQFDSANPTTYMGIAALFCNSGGKTTTAGDSTTIKSDAFGFMNNQDTVITDLPGDFRMWIGTGPHNITTLRENSAGVRAIFAFVGGSSLQEIQDNAVTALCRADDVWGVASRNSAVCHPTGIEDGVHDVLPNYTLHQNYPNPFNPTTTIEFSLPESSYVTLKIYNSLGQEVTTVISAKLSEGTHKYYWDASDLVGGVYFYRIDVDGFFFAKKALLLK